MFKTISCHIKIHNLHKNTKKIIYTKHVRVILQNFEIFITWILTNLGGFFVLDQNGKLPRGCKVATCLKSFL